MEIETKIEDSLFQYSSLPQQQINQQSSYNAEDIISDEVVIHFDEDKRIAEISIMDIIAGGTITIGLILFIFQLFGYIWFHRLLRLSASPIGKTKVQLLKSDLVDSPLLTGLFHPVIVLPSSLLSHPHLDVIILHELTQQDIDEIRAIIDRKGK